MRNVKTSVLNVIMDNVKEIKRIIGENGFVRTGKRDIWTRDSWTIRFFEDDIEIYDSIDKSAYYLVANSEYLDIRPIIADIDYISKQY